MIRMFHATARRLLAIVAAINHSHPKPKSLWRLAKETSVLQEPLVNGGNSRLSEQTRHAITTALDSGLLGIEGVTLDDVVTELADIIGTEDHPLDSENILDHLEHMLGLPYPANNNFYPKIPALRRLILGKERAEKLEEVEIGTLVCANDKCGTPITSGSMVRVALPEAVKESGTRGTVPVPQLFCEKCANATMQDPYRNVDPPRRVAPPPRFRPTFGGDNIANTAPNMEIQFRPNQPEVAVAREREMIMRQEQEILRAMMNLRPTAARFRAAQPADPFIPLMNTVGDDDDEPEIE